MIEQAIIGILLKKPDTITRAGLKVEHFNDDFCVRAFGAMRSLVTKGIVPDVVSVAESMGGNLGDNLGILTAWLGETVSAANLDHWVNRLKDAHKTAQVKQMLTEALASSEGADAIRAKLITQLASIEDDGRSYETGGTEWMGQVVEKVEEVWEAKQSGSGTVGVTSGNADMDSYLGGFHRADLVIMGARPKMGKTAWLMNCARSASMAGKRVGVASAEMPAWQLGERIVSDVANLSASVFRTGNLSDRDFSSLTYGCERVAGLPIRIFDKPRMTVGDIAIQAKAWELSGGIDIIFVDYLTRLVPDQPEKNRTREVGRMVSDLKTLARTMNIPIVCLAQLSRAVEERSDKRPMPSDLRDSGEIEQEADVIMFLYRDAVYNDQADARSGEILIEANRHGPTGVIRCTFDGEFMRWASAELPDPMDYAA